MEINHRDEFGHWLNAHGLTGVGVEVGVFGANYSEVLASAWHGTLIGIDPYQPFTGLDPMCAEDAAFFEAKRQYAVQHMLPLRNFSLLRLTSVEAARLFADRTLDFVYIDANHEAIVEDIAVWHSKVRQGGILCGHDYGPPHPDYPWADAVKPAVDDFCRATGSKLYRSRDESSWWVPLGGVS